MRFDTDLAYLKSITMPRIILLLLTITIVSSCTSYKQLAKQDPNETTYYYDKNLEGSYENEVSENQKVSLWQDLYRARYNKDIPHSAYRTQVKINVPSDRELIATLYRDGRKEDSLLFKGKQKGKYFVLRKRSRFLPLFPILLASEGTKTIIGNDLEGNLTLVQKISSSSSSPLLNTSSGIDAEVITAVYARK
ncbi:hypothetical protein [Nonlabens ponticola]|uniref:Lipoprotein n=1 Tax=Nonlabens ponticola TaxID=2496866 RepID=A0A3S9MY58_9FLAO|nr:hypothetical protein [Nonlabens ponticola]AZQ43983.1 hypothetical protein EJ995_06955 [Nonlabens ponticola]